MCAKAESRAPGLCFSEKDTWIPCRGRQLQFSAGSTDLGSWYVELIDRWMTCGLLLQLAVSCSHAEWPWSYSSPLKPECLSGVINASCLFLALEQRYFLFWKKLFFSTVFLFWKVITSEYNFYALLFTRAFWEINLYHNFCDTYNFFLTSISKIIFEHNFYNI